MKEGGAPSENKAMMERFLRDLDEDIGAIDKFLSPDCQTHLPGSNLPVDREGFKMFVCMLYTAFPDLHHEIEHQIGEGEKVASLVTVRGTHKGDFQGVLPTGRQVTFTDIIMARIEDGKLIALWAQFDVLGLLNELGAG
ncbi:MAG: ester cyclase [Syntrophus sp. (in: bacteria)]|nr:ester cyclase [Syntrophus sp. (in: bacteria)]